MGIKLLPGVYSATVALAGAGAVVIWPNQLWIGYSLLLAAGLLFLWGIRVSERHIWATLQEWLSRNLWWRFRLSPPIAPVVPIASLEDWMPLHKALRYLVYNSQWGASQPAVEDKEQFDKVVLSEFRERMARGDIAARGKKGVREEGSGRATEKIDPAFWVEALIQAHGEIALAEDKRSIAFVGGGGPSYHAIILSRTDVEKTWPRNSETRLTALAQTVEPIRAKIHDEKPLPAPRPSFETPPEFDYPYPKAVLRTEVLEAKGQRSARDGLAYQMGVRMGLKNAHGKVLKDCSIFVRDLTCGGKVTEIGEALRIGKEVTFDLYPSSQDKIFGIVTRDISDPITPAPFLIKLASRDLPLAENSQYLLTLELRSRYPFPTLCHLQIDTGEGLDAHVQILAQKLSETSLSPGQPISISPLVTQ